MQLNHEFTVDAPLDEVWQALLDPHRVAPCMPGATLDEVNGDEFAATVQVKLGPVNLKYKGKGAYVDKDEQAKRLVIKASGKDVRGAGTASGSATVTLTDAGGATHGEVVSELKVTGRPAQFGRGLIAEVGGRLLGEFAKNLGQELSGNSGHAGGQDGDTASATQAAGQRTPESGTAASRQAQAPSADEPSAGSSGRSQPSQAEPEAINLLQVAGGPMLKRLAPVLAVLAVVLGLVVLRRSRRT